MVKWIRRFLYFTAFVLVLAIVASYVFYRMSLATPEWWMPQYTDESQWRAAANRMDQKLATAVNRVAELYAAETRQRGDETAPTTAPADPAERTIEVEITDEELNAFFHKWRGINQWDKALSGYVRDLQVHLKDGQLILGGKMVGVELLEGRIVHAHFRPAVADDGQLNLTLQGVWSGRLPLPAATWNSQKERLIHAIEAQLPQLRRQAQIDVNGHSNGQAVSAAMGQLLVNMLRNRPSDPVLFVPSSSGSIPVRLTAVRIEQQTLKLVAQPLTPDERQAFVQKLREAH